MARIREIRAQSTRVRLFRAGHARDAALHFFSPLERRLLVSGRGKCCQPTFLHPWPSVEFRRFSNFLQLRLELGPGVSSSIHFRPFYSGRETWLGCLQLKSLLSLKALGQFAFDQKSPEPFNSKIFAHIPVQKILVCQGVYSCISWLMNDITQGASHFESSSKDSQSDRSQQSARSQQQEGVHNTPLVVAEGGKIPWDHPTRPFTRAHWSRSR